MSRRRVVIRCPGKVNLHLEVVRRRPDGYHELRTLFVAVGVWDRLELAATPDGSLALAVDPPGAVSAGPDNLVLRAAHAARAAWGVAEGARITLRKGIPVAGGMGGGSADAAATLVALAALWRRPQPIAALHDLGAALGSDVPYFLAGGAAWGEGRGERLRALPDLPPWWVVLVPGDRPVATAEVFSRLQPGDIGRGPAAPVYDWLAGGADLPLAALRNDLEGAVTAGWPWVGERLAAMRRAGAPVALVSGSGGTVFGLWRDEREARAGAARCGPLATVVAPLLGRDGSRLRPVVGEGS
jgi:4-diphosphocytidyl-2-C-methyl-D-erythritol kinase